MYSARLFVCASAIFPSGVAGGSATALPARLVSRSAAITIGVDRCGFNNEMMTCAAHVCLTRPHTLSPGDYRGLEGPPEYGVPPKVYVSKLSHMRFEPSGMKAQLAL